MEHYLPVLGSSHFFVKTASPGSHSHFKEPLRFSLMFSPCLWASFDPLSPL
jgi:hypothetical protein